MVIPCTTAANELQTREERLDKVFVEVAQRRRVRGDEDVNLMVLCNVSDSLEELFTRWLVELENCAAMTLFESLELFLACSDGSESEDRKLCHVSNALDGWVWVERS